MNKMSQFEIGQKLKTLSPLQRKALLKLLKLDGVDVSMFMQIEPREPSALPPLSFAQQRLWILDQLEGASAGYNMPLALRLEGQLNVDALRASIKQIVLRHEALRTRFLTEEGKPRLVIDDGEDFTVKIIPADDPNMDLQAACQQEANVPFDLSTDCLIRANLLVINSQDHILQLTMHHIVSDGWSMTVFFKELVALYQAFATGQPSPLPPLAIQYADFALWQRGWLSGEVLAKQSTYWQQQLTGLAPLLELPTDKARPAMISNRGDRQHFTVPNALLQQLNQLSNSHQATLYMSTLAVFYILLSRYSGQTDLAVGSPIANRNRAELEPLIGFFVNTLVMRVDLAGDPHFVELLGRVRKMAHDAYSHQDLPFEQLIEILQPQRSLAYSPLFQVMFKVENQGMTATKTDQLALSSMDLAMHTAKFDLTVNLEQTEQGLVGEVEYNSDIFAPATIDRLIHHYLTLLAAAVAAPTAPISTLDLLSDQERSQQHSWNQTRSDYPADQCISQLFEAQVAKNPYAIALEFEGQLLSYEGLNYKANQVAHYLRSLGVKPDTLVAVCLDRSIEMVIAVLAIIKAGGAYVPVDPNYPAERIQYIFSDANIAIVLSQQAKADLATDDQYWLYLDTGSDNRGAVERIAPLSGQNLPLAGLTPQHLVHVIYTSGSTGKPKGVLVEQQGVVRLVCQTDFIPLNADLVMLQQTTLSFDVSSFELWAPLLNGGRLVVYGGETTDIEAMMATVAQRQVNTMALTPSLLQLWLAQYPKPVSCLKTLVVAGEALPVASVWQMYQLNPQLTIIDAYGPTENAVYSVAYKVPNNISLGDIKPIGKPIAQSTAYVLDPRGNPVPVGCVGELCVGGDGVARGYLNRPELTAAQFVDDTFSPASCARLYKTGDLARRLADGNIQYLGRIDNQIKLRGFRIEPGEIESLLASHSAVLACAVMVREDIPGDKRLVAYVVLKSDAANQSDGDSIQTQLLNHLRAGLPDYMVPGAFVLLDSLPMTANGKLDSRALPAPDDSAYARDVYVAPTNAIEQTLAEVCQQVLNIGQVGIRDNFFAIGGNSILSIQLISRAREQGIALTMRQVFEAQTIEEMAALHAGATKEGSTGGDSEHIVLPPITVVNRPPYLPLSFTQRRLWIVSQVELQKASYNLPYAFNIEGLLSVKSLQQAFNAIIERHGTLRTRFVSKQGVNDGQPYQDIMDHVDFTINQTDLSAFSPEQQAQQVQTMADADAMTAFDLSNGLMIRVSLLKLNNHHHVMLLNCHHIASDGWSMGVLLNEVGYFYQAFQQGQSAPALPPLPLQYADYALWQQAWMAGDVLKAHLDYWRTTLTGLPQLHNLPLDKSRPAERSYRGDYHTQVLGHSVADQLTAFNQSHGTTVFMTMQAALATFIARLSGEEDIAVGFSVSNRVHQEVEGLIGFFANTLILRSDLAGNPRFIDVLAATKDRSLSALAHQHMPFELLIEELNPERSLSYSPLFQLMLVVDNNPEAQVQQSDFKVSPCEQAFPISKFDLTLYVKESPEHGLILNWAYATDLFEPATIARMAGYFEVMLGAIFNQPSQTIGELPLLTSEQTRQLRDEFNATDHDYPRELCMHELFEQQVALHPDNVAVQFKQQQISYRELNDRANQLAHYLIASGVKPDSFVGVCIERSIEMMVALFGILKAGGAYVPLDPNYPEARFSHILTDSKVKIVITQSQHQHTLTMADQLILLDDYQDISRHQPELKQQSTANPNRGELGLNQHHLAYIIYTSGSTGLPKGVAVNHQSVVNFLNFGQRVFMPAHMDASVVSTTLAFDATVGSLYPPLCCGRYVILLPDDEDLLVHLEHCLLKDHRSLSFKLTPSHLKAIAANGNLCSNSTSRHFVVIAGEQLTEKTLYRWKTQLLPSSELINEYGPTEATVGSCTYHGVDQQGLVADSLKAIPIGKPLDNIKFYIVNPQWQLQPIGVPGELYIGGECLAREYLNQPQMTREKFVDNPFSTTPGSRLYRTGDSVRWLADGNVEFIGRLDHQVKIRGFRIELGEIESQLQSHTMVQDCVVLAKEDEQGEKRLTAYVVQKPSDDSTVGDNQLIGLYRQHLAKALPEYMIPAAFSFVAEIPLTVNGKVDRKALLVLANSSVYQDTYVAPQDLHQRNLCEIWQEILEVERIGINDNFFASGGDSILAIQVISRARELDIQLDMRQMFEGQTIAAISQMHREANGEEDAIRVPPISAVSRPEYLPLSFTQRRLWVVAQVESEQSSYNLPSAFNLEGRFNLPALGQAFSAIIDRHATLRTVFKDEMGKNHGEPYQLILAEPNFAITELDLTGYSGEEQANQVQALADEDAMKPFDLSHDLMVRVSVLKLAEQHHVMLLNRHHIASDGWSMNVMLKELFYFYDAFDKGIANPALPPLALQFADYALWQQGWMQGPVLTAHIDYWRQALQGLPELHNLPLDKPRPAKRSYRGDGFVSVAGPEVAAALQQFNQQHDVTLFMTLQAVFAAFLARFSGEDDIVIGFSIANRVHKEIEDLIGFFANTLVLRSDLSGNPKFSDFLAQTQENSLSALAHQHLPFELLIDALNPPRTLSHSPLFQIMLVVDNNPAQTPQQGDLKVSAVAQDFPISKFDLTLYVKILPEEGLVFNWVYATDLFNAQTIERMAGHFNVLLKGVMANPALTIGELPLLTRKDEQQLRVDFNATAQPYPRELCIHELFEQQVRLHPDNIAVEYKNQQLSYNELNQRANQLAHYLLASGVQPDCFVGVCIERSIEMLIALLAILKAGGAYVPLDPNYPTARFEHILSDSKVSLVITQSQHKATLAMAQQLIYLDDFQDVSRSQPELKAMSEVDPNRAELGLTQHHLAYIIYTSGSTGLPKGVAVNHQSVVNFLNFGRRVFMPDYMDASVVSTTLAFDATVGSLYPPLCCGKTVILLPDDEELLLHLEYCLLKDHRSLSFKLTPSHLKAITASYSNSVSRHLLVIAGEQLTEKTLFRWKHHLLPNSTLINEYGPTEATVGSCTYHGVDDQQLSAGSLKAIPIGKPLDNIQFYIVNPQWQLQPIGVPGELYIGGECLAREYLNQPAMTAEKFVKNRFSTDPTARLYRTGDQVRWLSDGNVEFIGRFDHQVKIRGFRIELGEIESQLQRHPRVQDSVVLAKEDDQGEKRLTAYVVKTLSDDSNMGDNQLIGLYREFLAQALPDYMVPAVFSFVPAIPLTVNGKVDRKALLSITETSVFKETYVAPQNEQQSELCRIWQEILQVDRIGIEDNFFANGGDSILAIQVIAMAREQGIDLSMRNMFEGQTIAAVCEADETVEVLMPQEATTGEQVLLPVQQWYLQGEALDRHYFHQSVVLTVPEGMDYDFLRAMTAALYQRHDVLRSRFVCNEHGHWQGHYQPLSNHMINETLGYERLWADDHLEQQSYVQQFGSLIKTNMNLRYGPLFRMVYFEAAQPQDSRLLLVFHHLLVDGVSWRIILEDLSVGFKQYHSKDKAARDQAIELGSKSSAYQQWGDAVQRYSTSEAMAAEKAYWLQSFAIERSPLPVDHLVVTDNTLLASKIVTGQLNQSETRALLRECHGAYDTKINDLLLAGLLLAFNRWADRQAILIRMEGHGRELLFPELDVSQTVGWFTSIYPLALTLNHGGAGQASGLADGQMADLIRGVKNQLAAVPNNGVGYGILHYIAADPQLLNAAQDVEFDIAFNYLGQFDQVAGEGRLFSASGESAGVDISERRSRVYSLKITAGVGEGQFGFRFEYNGQQYNQETMDRLAADYANSLRDIISHCQVIESGRLSLADFPLTDNSQQQLDQWLARYPDLFGAPTQHHEHLPFFALSHDRNRDGEIVYPVSYSQKMLWHFTKDPAIGAVLRSFRAFNLTDVGDNKLDIIALEQALLAMTERHDVFRMHFVRYKNEVVLSLNPQMGANIRLIDVTDPASTHHHLQGDEQGIRQLLVEEINSDYDLYQGPLMRCLMVRKTATSVDVVFGINHLISDRWSWGIFQQEVELLYRAFCHGNEAELPTILVSYSDYCYWNRYWHTTSIYQQQLQFWRQAFADFTLTQQFPTDKSLVAGSPSAGSLNRNYLLDIPEGLFSQIDDYCREHSITLYTLFVAVFHLCLYRYSGLTDLVVVSPKAERTRPELSRTIGLYLNLLVIHARVDSQGPLSDFIKQMKQRVIDAQANMDVHVEALVEVIDCDPALPLSDINFQYYNFPDEKPADFAGLQTQPLMFGEDDIDYANTLDLRLVRTTAGASGLFVYNQGLFDHSTIATMATDYLGLLAVVVNGAQGSIEEAIAGLGEGMVETSSDQS